MKKILAYFLLTTITLATFGQGVTTSSMNGRVFDDKKESLPGTAVIAVHTPTGTEYATTTDSKGYFRIPNMNVGGPYTLTVSFVGFKKFEQKDIYLTLGQAGKFNVKLSSESVGLDEVVVVGSMVGQRDLFDGNRTGAETVITAEEIKKVPTISGNLNDYFKLTPQATETADGGISIAGINNRYNAVFIDGTVNNDVFGLSDNGMNGGKTGVSAISNEAIEQFQVVIAPYDIRQGGFAGASINAITKSGTNNFKGSAYFKYRNQNLAGKTPGEIDVDDREKLDDFTAKTYGFTLGGPIIKNKLFFFTNVEMQDDETPQPFNFTQYAGDSDKAKIDQLINKLNGYGYDPGTLDGTRKLTGRKILAKLDWNINSDHRLSLRTQYTYGESLSPSRSSSRSLNFSNSGVKFPSTTISSALELKSRFGNMFSNNLKIGYTSVLDDRGQMGSKFPSVEIDDGDGSIEFGSEMYSTGNKLEQKILTITDNFQIFMNNHTITIGTHNEFYDVYNMFMKRAWGAYEYDSLDKFLNDENADRYRMTYSLLDDIRGDGSKSAADFKAMQLGFYIQDEWQATDNFKLTAGLRLDIPMFSDDPIEVPNFNKDGIPEIEKVYDLKGAKSGSMPKSQFLWSPRVGFNWDVNGQKTTQIRGGLGIFTSRLPLVWAAGSYTNNGQILGSIEEYDKIKFNPDVTKQEKGVTTPPSDLSKYLGGSLDIYAEDFKFPQTFRTNLAVDQKLPFGVVGTVEFVYSKTLNNVLWKNVNVKPSWGKVDGADNRDLYKTYKNGIVPMFGEIMLGDNTNKGYSYTITAQLRKDFDFGLKTSLAYTYGRAEAIFDGTSSQNTSQWNYLQVGPYSRNNPELTTSDFDLGHKIIGSVSYEKEFFNHLKTTIALYYHGQSGRPFSYIYNLGDDRYGNFTGESYKNPALIYIPRDASEINLVDDGDRTAAQQWEELNAFIESDDYLKDRRGKYAERNGSRLPFVNKFDLHFSQEIFSKIGGRKNSLELTIDIFNVGNMLNKNWGVEYYVSHGNFQLIKFKSMSKDANGDRTIPSFTFKAPKDNEPYYVDDSGLTSSRWQAMIGIRYKF